MDTKAISQLLEQKLGLSEEQATGAVHLVLEQIRTRIPAQYQGIAASILGDGASPEAAAPGTETGGLGSLMGKAKDMFNVPKE